MNDNQFNKICKKLDNIYAIILIQSIDNRDDKIYTLKRLGFSSEEIGLLVGVKNVRKLEGWKRK